MTARIPAANDTRWNSYLRLHEHILKHFDDINVGLNQVNRSELILSTNDKDNLSQVVNIMQYFSEATDILQSEEEPTAGRVIPVIDSLENALNNIEQTTPPTNALIQCLLNSLQSRFSYLLDSSIHQAATALDPNIKLKFTDKTCPGKHYVYSSSLVKDKIKSLLPVRAQQVMSPSPSLIPSEKRRRLMDYCSTASQSHSQEALSSLDVQLQEYFDTPTVNVKPTVFWLGRNDSPLKTLALELLSVPSSSAPVERLFSKAGIILNQRRTRLSSKNLEELLSFK